MAALHGPCVHAEELALLPLIQLLHLAGPLVLSPINLRIAPELGMPAGRRAAVLLGDVIPVRTMTHLGSAAKMCPWGGKNRE